ncbi:hypothetical protein LWC34_29295 [Kibdelosporangium philippinense]|uniref:Uncharacterized protein n=1 Tax=Kibdelosporangium philippinense TaxID=211113 RepID=A0ABS8ZHD1_9PSEU|nr:hypothetical protein [Kibdelosporangium philippinense]MCE7006892.1 hypothetical protein [Kibdelosporangium philippinense]
MALLAETSDLDNVLKRLRQRHDGVRTGLKSLNGWEMESAADTYGRIHTHPVPGTPLGGVQVRTGEVKTLLTYVIRRVHSEVIELRAGDVTGWCPPDAVDDLLPESNLASGTAIRIRLSNQLFAPQVVAARAIVRDLDRVVGWGGDDACADQSLFFIDVEPGAVSLSLVAQRVRLSDLP